MPRPLPQRVLVVDDEPALRYTLSEILGDEGLEVTTAKDGAEALAALDAQPIDLVVSDLVMPNVDGLELLATLAQRPDAPGVVLVTAHGDERLAVQAMRLGALDYLPKPFQADEVLRVVLRALDRVSLQQANATLEARLAVSDRLVFASDAMERVARLIARIGPRDVTVLVTGPTGTGKEVVARCIADASTRARGPFVALNCAALPAELVEAELFGHAAGAFTGATAARNGLFRAAEGGTLLLDEVDALSARAQASLLRALQERTVRPLGTDKEVPVDIRLLVTCNRDLRRVESFRQDLYYRLAVVTLDLPPLAERPADIGPLARHFARLHGERMGLGECRVSPSLLAQLEAQDWPGNVRELSNVIERRVALSESPDLGAEEPGDTQSAPPTGLRDRVEAFERSIIRQALLAQDGNRSATARALGIGRVTLLDKLKRHGLS
jgi:two-component system, NtrC family, response regulator HydG